ncbi:uncharacterized protein LOC105426485 [Pogonomyrmex barbatus]|uniref:Uncharacterized protein LOC105426485 n=1 Tax=Pogonomyrmex barbatus TaxID=144034 RepID=A0A6I9W6X3_9HYME|nr:uncharacterized protein LOC105426485 [Pogonomyrmex barbatus]
MQAKRLNRKLIYYFFKVRGRGRKRTGTAKWSRLAVIAVLELGRRRRFEIQNKTTPICRCRLGFKVGPPLSRSLDSAKLNLFNESEIHRLKKNGGKGETKEISAEEEEEKEEEEKSLAGKREKRLLKKAEEEEPEIQRRSNLRRRFFDGHDNVKADDADSEIGNDAQRFFRHLSHPDTSGAAVYRNNGHSWIRDNRIEGRLEAFLEGIPERIPSSSLAYFLELAGILLGK